MAASTRGQLVRWHTGPVAARTCMLHVMVLLLFHEGLPCLLGLTLVFASAVSLFHLAGRAGRDGQHVRTHRPTASR
jgi:hypothetical protein